jgi:O-antigen ligase
MAHLLLSRQQAGRAVTPGNSSLLRHVKPIIKPDTCKWIIRYTFYAFIFSLPFEEAYIDLGASVPRLIGLALAGFGLLQLRLCYEFPPKAFWWFVAYLSIYTLWGFYLISTPPNVPNFPISFIASAIKLVQLLVLFWISYNLMKQEQVVNGALWALAAGAIILAILQVLGITGDVSKGRMAAFSEQNPNGLATILSLGLLALFGLAYGREKHDWKGRLLFWLGSGILAVGMVQTGSRGAAVALVGSLSVFFLRGKSLATKLKFGLIALAGIIVLVGASYQIDVVRKRWERTFYDQDLAGRQRIYPEAIGMILESPLIGWGPVNHLWEMGPRVGKPYRDEHNVYLWILAEVGLVGAIPFFAGLWLCCRSAWRARHGSQGILPLVMLLFLLALSMKGTLHKNKYFWVVLSFALAASSYTGASPRLKMGVSATSPGFSAVTRGRKLVKVPARGRARGLSRSRYSGPRS